MAYNKVGTTARRTDTPLNAPVYRRIEQDLRERIRLGQWTVGMRLPSRKILAHEYEVDLTTLQRAISTLLADGTLYAEAPHGTFVARSIEPLAEPIEDRAVVEISDEIARQAPVIRAVPRGNTRIVATLGAMAYTKVRTANWDAVVMDMLERTFAEAGGTIRFIDLMEEEGHPSPAEVASELLAAGVDVLAFVNVYDRPGRMKQFISALDVGRTPAMIVCWEDLEHPVPHVFYDNRYAGYQAADHLISSGYRPLYFLMPFHALWAEERYCGAVRAAQGTGSEPIPITLLKGEADRYNAPDGEEILRRLMQPLFAELKEGGTPGMPPGLIAANDNVAHIVLSLAEEAGLCAGADFGLIGFNDDASSRSAGLTSLRPPLEELGREAARNLIRMVQGETIPIQIRLQSQLIPRGSTIPGSL